MRARPDRATLRDGMRHAANRSRRTADQMAVMLNGCDDPMEPFMPIVSLQEHYTSWREFARVVCNPIEANDEWTDPALQEAMSLFRKVNPHYLAVCLSMADRTVDRMEERISELEAILEDRT